MKVMPDLGMAIDTQMPADNPQATGPAIKPAIDNENIVRRSDRGRGTSARAGIDTPHASDDQWSLEQKARPCRPSRRGRHGCSRYEKIARSQLGRVIVEDCKGYGIKVGIGAIPIEIERTRRRIVENPVGLVFRRGAEMEGVR